MKILITGSSGYIGTMLRQIFANNEVSLLSRQRIAPGKNEEWFPSGNVQDPGWWNALSPDSNFEVIFHLAEPVKESINSKVMQNIMDGHVSFISHFTNKGAKLIYPLTAYLYDTRLSRSDTSYAEIKRGVYRQIKDNTSVSFPIIHPICDSGHGLGRLIQNEKRIPFVNIMCAFESTIPVLELEHLRQVFADPNSLTHERLDVFSEILAIKQLFKDDARANVFWLSRTLRHVLTFLRFVPSFNLLVKGRHIDDSML